jgi:hypothetical protein
MAVDDSPYLLSLRQANVVDRIVAKTKKALPTHVHQTGLLCFQIVPKT